MYNQTATPKSPTPTLQHLAAADERLCADSRQIRAGDTFVACRGEYTDGRDYIQAAIDNLAQASCIGMRTAVFSGGRNGTCRTRLFDLRQMAELYLPPKHTAAAFQAACTSSA